MIRIRSKRDGFRRCGIAHPSMTVEYPDGRFSREELAVLKAEPMLLVEEIEEEKNPGPETETGGGGEKNPSAGENRKEQVKTGKKGKTS